MKTKTKIGIAIAIFGIVVGIAAATSSLAGIKTPFGKYYISTNATYNGIWTDVYCDAGDQVISGGGDAGLINGPGSLRESTPLSNNVWRVSSINRDGQNVQTESPKAVCFHPSFRIP